MKSTLLFFLLIFLPVCTLKPSEIVDLEALYQKNMNDSTLVTGWYNITNDSSGFVRKLNKSEDIYYVDPRPIAVAGNLTEIHLQNNNSGYLFISMQFDKQATEWWSIATREATGGYIAFVVNNELLGVLYVNHEITMGQNAFGHKLYTKEEYEKLIEDIKSSKDSN